VKRIGPELKMPKLKGSEMKVPPFLSDLHHDLRERRLLPLVALIIVGIVAAPIVLKNDSGEAEPASPPSAVPGPGAKTAAQTLSVVKAEPGLRNYKKRLGRRAPTNPFKQRFTGPRLAGSELNEETSTTSTTTTTTTESGGGSETVVPAPSGESGGGPSPGGGGGGPAGGDGDITFFTFAIDVQLSRATTKPDGTVEKTDPKLHEHLLPPATLPGEKAPVVTYLGLGAKQHLPMFLVADDVSAAFGEGKCVSGTGTCRLIELQPNMPETFVFGENDARYKIVVTKIEPVVDGNS
jgi:hypothetical protein